MKKRKLNSNNPKYNKDIESKKEYKKVLMKETKLFKLYFCYEK
tara:strand:+ start:1197 stop:1325 length:129 start_codon:yes stop_codon:yes gene_type:complete